MPSLTKRIPIGISFDAQNTLVEVVGGIGLQYFKHFREYLLRKGYTVEEAMPSCTATSLHTTSFTILRYAVNRDREAWAAAHPESSDRREMPIGGRSEEAILKFWRNSMMDVFKSPSLFLSTPPRLKQSLLDVMEGPDWDRFTEDLLHHFSTPKCYSWLPEGRHTLEALRKWNIAQEELTFKARGPRGRKNEHTTAVSPKPAAIVLAAPPFVVTNSDFRMRNLFKELGALQSELPSSTPNASSLLQSGKKLPPLIGKVITAGDIGYAKPSPRGILHCMRECGLEKHPDRFLHIGDTEEDELACRAAGCRYLQTNASVGVHWEKLKASLIEMEKDAIKSSR